MTSAVSGGVYNSLSSIETTPSNLEDIRRKTMSKNNIKRKTKSKNKHKTQETGEVILDDVEIDRKREQERCLLRLPSKCRPESETSDFVQRRGSHKQGRSAKSRINNNLALDTGKIPLVPLLTDTTSVKRNVAIFSDIWKALSWFFCFTSSYYIPEDDYILYTGSDDETDIPVISSRKKKHISAISSQKKEQETPDFIITETMRVFDDWNRVAPVLNLQASSRLFFCKEGDYVNDKDLLGSHLYEEGQRIFEIFVGIKRINGLTFNWNLRTSENGIDVHTCDVPNSSWLAVKADSIIHQDKYEILKLFLDDSRSHEYDHSMLGFEVIGFISIDLQFITSHAFLMS